MAHDEWMTRLDLQTVPIGHVLDTRMEPTPEEVEAFQDWVCPLNPHPRWGRASSLRVTTEDADGRHVLEYWAKVDQSLVTGDLDWRDVRIETGVRQLIATSSPGPDDEVASVARCGVMARVWTVRHYYLFCLEGLERIVLYRRENSVYTPLATHEMAVDPNRYYRLRLEVRGNRLRGYCDDELVADAFDPAHTHGRVGIRTNALSRFEEVTARLTPREVGLLSASREREAAALEEIRAAYPKPVLWRSLDLKAHRAGGVLGIGRYGSGEENDLLLNGQTADGKPALTAITLEGEAIWTREIDGPIGNVKTHDINGGGVHTIAGLYGGEIVVLDGGSGEEVARRPYPETGPFQGLRGEKAFLESLYIAHLRPGEQARDILVKECDPGGGHSCWCYDEGLNLRWSRTVDQPRHGHHFGFYDFDGDGLEEICAGYHLLGPDGEVRWRIEGGQSFEVFQYGRHADNCAGGDFDGDGRGEVAIAGGSEGVFLCDGETGEVIARHYIGHAQGLSVASFRADLPGMEIQVGTRWGNYGIRAFYSGEGAHLLTFQPDLLGQQGEPVNWRGDGAELLFLGSSADVFGLWDAFGRKVVDLPGMERESMQETGRSQVHQGIRQSDQAHIGQILFVDVTGDPRDEVLLLQDGELLIYTQDAGPPDPSRVYAPIRYRRLGNPKVSYPNWRESR